MNTDKKITLYGYEIYKPDWNWWSTSDLNWTTREFLDEYLGAGLYNPNVRIISREFSLRQILEYPLRFPEDVVKIVEEVNLL